MRDQRFIAEHRGGLLKKEQHRQLMLWACDCAEHGLLSKGDHPDERLLKALWIGRAWVIGNATVGEAMKASVAAHAVARTYPNPVSTAVARSVGHAVATAHMADHSLGAALYALKALKIEGKPIDEEREWQSMQLHAIFKDDTSGIVELVLSTLIQKEKSMKISRA